MATKYKSDIVLGERYRDTQTGFEGIATAIFFFQYGCERVEIQSYVAERQDIKSNVFDAPRLQSVKTGKTAKVDKTGGPGSPLEGRGNIDARSSVESR